MRYALTTTLTMFSWSLVNRMFNCGNGYTSHCYCTKRYTNTQEELGGFIPGMNSEVFTAVPCKGENE